MGYETIGAFYFERAYQIANRGAFGPGQSAFGEPNSGVEKPM
jgi:hypothetical protein